MDDDLHLELPGGEPADLLGALDYTTLAVKGRRGVVLVTGETSLANYMVMQRLFDAYCAERKPVGSLIDGPAFAVPEHSDFESQRLIGPDAHWVSAGQGAPRQMLDTIFLHEIANGDSSQCLLDVSFSIARVVASVPSPAADTFAYLDTLRPRYEGTLTGRLRNCVVAWIDVDRYGGARFVDSSALREQA